jgi:hypothetical protein
MSDNWVFTAAVDIFDGLNNVWTTASLSQARGCAVAASLDTQSIALFAGGLVSYAEDGSELYNEV